MSDSEFKSGTFGYDLKFLDKYSDIVVLKDDIGEGQVIVSPKLQGKVLTSTAFGMEGNSYGWINFDLISSGQILEHMNGYGGEDRIWLGPEGGQYSIFFKPGTEMKIENWYTPKEIDTDSFDLISSSDKKVLMEKNMHLINYSQTEFDLKIKREVCLLKKDDINNRLNLSVTEQIHTVAFETKNVLVNTGQRAWTKESGTLCIWILGMFKPSPKATVIVPFVKGNEDQLGKIVTSDYFGQIPPNRLDIEKNVILFRGDGKFRSKIGISAKRAKNIAGSYDPEGNVLTVIQYSLPTEHQGYINQLWKIQDDPYNGDVVNSYNDGPLSDGTQMGPFYELESSSPAAFLEPGESIVHNHATFHFVGSESQLSEISIRLFGIDLNTIKSAF